MSSPQHWLQEILRLTETLLNDESLNHQQRTFIEIIQGNAQQLVRLFSDLPNAALRLFDLDNTTFNSPQAGMLGYSMMLLEHPENFGTRSISDDQRHYLRLIHDRAARLRDWTNSLKEAQTSERQQMHDAPSQPTNLNLFLADCVPLYQYFLKDQPVELVTEIPDDLPLVMANAYHLRYLIRHIIHTIASELIDGGKIMLSAAVEAKFVALTISCDTLQLSADALNILFQKQGRHIYRQRLEEQGAHIRIVSQSSLALFLARS